jgi:thiamine biosynthesis lipoprotein
MGTVFALSIGTDCELRAPEVASLAAETVESIEAQLSWRRPHADVARINTGAAVAPLGDHTRACLARAWELSAATGGRFSPQVGERKLDLDGIGKGYAADVLAQQLRAHGVKNFLISAGVSSLVGAGERHEGGPWRVGIRAPDGPPARVVGTAMLGGTAGLEGLALATSGIDRRGQHILDPATGCPPTNGIRQATAFASDATAAEAYSTALVVGGIECAAALTDTPGFFGAILITPDTVTVSSSLQQPPAIFRAANQE